MYDVIIIGAGPAGLSAGIYALRSGLAALVLDKTSWGGQTVFSAEIENYPAVPSVTGPDFALKMYDQLINLGGRIMIEEVLNIDQDKMIVTTNRDTYETRAIIIAAGLRRKKLGCLGENDFQGKGVSYCAVCDGRFFTDRDVVVVGGGNTAMEDALYMSAYCRSVTIVCRRRGLKGEESIRKSVKKKKNVRVIYTANVKEIKGARTVEKVILDNGTELKTSAVFIAIGYEADSNFIPEFVDMTDRGYVIADESCETNIEGIFVAGDLRTKKVRQIVTAASDGAVAALAAADHIINKI